MVNKDKRNVASSEESFTEEEEGESEKSEPIDA
jgi:hypothetical protein